MRFSIFDHERELFCVEETVYPYFNTHIYGFLLEYTYEDDR